MKSFRLATAILSAICFAGLVSADSPKETDKSNPNSAKKAFEKLKTSLVGDWEGKSTKGWTERVIAGGSVLMEVSYGAHPDDWMATMYYMDGDRLMLTHYCAAKNQPRLVAIGFTDELKTLTFAFVDGTNIPTRDKGHMDKVQIKLTDKDHFSSRWTWYQDGKEKWLEDIEHRRIKTASEDPFRSTGK
jgi:hypothetical protein